MTFYSHLIIGLLVAAVLLASPAAAQLEFPRRPAGTPSEVSATTFDDVITELLQIRGRLDRAIQALEGLPDAAALRIRRDRLDSAIQLLRDLSMEGVARPPLNVVPPAPTVTAAQPPIIHIPPNPSQPPIIQTRRPPAWTSLSPSRGWIDVNFGVAASTADAETFTYGGLLFSEPYALAAAYPKPSTGAEFDFGGGYMLTPLVGVGLSFTGTAHEDAAGLGISIPHPYFFSEPALDAGPTGEQLQRTEGAAHFQFVVRPIRSDRFHLRTYAGPSFFRYEADLVQDIEFSQLATLFSRTNIVNITGYEALKTEGTGWGFHVGADAGYFFSRVVGLGGFARFSRGQVTIDEPMSEEEQKVTIGGFQFGGGLRLRF